jgi:zinc protease
MLRKRFLFSGIFLVLAIFVRTEAQITLPAQVQMTPLTNGIRVFMIEQKQLPMITITLMLRGGSGLDPLNQEGLARFTAALLTHGTKTRTAEQIAQEIDFIGGELRARVELERTLVTARVLKKDLKTALRLMGDVVRNPTFPEEEMVIVRNQLLSDVSRSRDNPTALIGDHLRHALYGPEQTLGQVMTLESIKNITREDIEKFHQRFYRPNAAIMVVSGDFDAAEAITEAKAAFLHWPAENRPIQPRDYAGDPARTPNGYEIRFVQKSGQTQTHIGMTHGGIMYKDGDYLAVQLANYVLGGGGFSSRLLQVVRSQAGKTYSISSRFTPFTFPGYFQISTFTRNEETVATLELIIQELRKFQAGGVTEEELSHAKGALAGRHILRFETLAGFAQAILDREFYERGTDWLSQFPQQVLAVTRDQVNEAIKNRFHPDTLIIVMLGDLQALAGHETLLGNVPTSEINVVNWNEPVTAQGQPLRLVTQPASGTCAANQVCAAIDEKAKGPVMAWLQTQGGLERISQIKDTISHWSGKVDVQGQFREILLEQRWLDPDKSYAAIEIRPANFFSSSIKYNQVINGNEGWLKFGSRIIERSVEELLTSGKELFFVQTELMPRILSNASFRLTHGGTATVENAQTDVIDVRAASAYQYKFYLDQSTHRLVKLDLAKDQEEYFFYDYRDRGGLWPAFRVRALLKGALISELTLKDVQYNVGVDPKLFERPK